MTTEDSPWGSRVRWALVFAAVAVTVYAQSTLWDWYIEDAAISFSYARNLAEGWGLARFPGDERIEGYSNPSWVLWMALWHLLGVDPWESSRWTAMALAAVTVPVTARFISIDGNRGWGLFGAWLLALDATFIIWSASGLENSLFCTFLACGLARTVLERESGRWNLAVFFWLGLAVTRPEGIVYAAIGGFWALLLEATGERRWRRIVWWLLAFFVPFSVYHFIRYDYFAHAFPATYYAKIGDDPFRPLAWNGFAWRYLRSYGEEFGRFYLSPLFLVGLLGLKGWRSWVVAFLSVWLGVVLLYPGVEPFISWGWVDPGRPDQTWIQFRVYSLLAMVVIASVTAIGAEGWRTRLLSWACLALGLAFCLRSGGDWMRGYRWLSLVSVPSAVLLALGCRDVFALCSRWLGRAGGGVGGALVTAAALGIVVPQVAYLDTYRPETTPASVRKRVKHYDRAMRRLHIDRASIVDHDMGAMMWWGADFGIIRDSKGLIDIAYARHRNERAFVEEYAFEEYPFDFAHGHASTGAALPRVRQWRRDYIEFPGYGTGRSFHVGNFVRKSLIMAPWEGTSRRAAEFRNDDHHVVLHGIDVPGPEITPGSWFYFEFGLQAPESPDGVRVVLFLFDDSGVAHTWHVPLGLDDWYPVETWGPDESQDGRIAVPIPRSLPHGDYGIGFAVFGPGGIVPAVEEEPGEPLYARGEKRWTIGDVHVVSRGAMNAEWRKELERMEKRAAAGKCLRADHSWQQARARRSNAGTWLREHRPIAGSVIGRCYAAKTLAKLPRAKAVEAMRKALFWTTTDPEVLARGVALADPWMEEADAAREVGDVERAYALYRDVLFVDPSRAWARRHAEDLRIIRLNLRR